jgi:hypothetical protein
MKLSYFSFMKKWSGTQNKTKERETVVWEPVRTIVAQKTAKLSFLSYF